MAEPKTEIEKRLDRQDLAIRTMAHWLHEAQTGFGAQDVLGIEGILDGTKSASEDSTSSAD